MARGEHLVRGDRGFATGGGMLARLFAPALSHVLDEVDRRLDHGGVPTVVAGRGRHRPGLSSPGPAAGGPVLSLVGLLRPSTPRPVRLYTTWGPGGWASALPAAN